MVEMVATLYISSSILKKTPEKLLEKVVFTET